MVISTEVVMAPVELDETRAGWDVEPMRNAGAGFAPTLAPERDDAALCFLCMRWTSGDPDCRRGARCEYQLALDAIDRM
jgi:hypothetical protein